MTGTATTSPTEASVGTRPRNRFWWVDLLTSDLEAAKRYYGELMGWQFVDMPFTGAEGSYTMASLDGHQVAGAMQISPEMHERGVPPCWQSYVLVDDVHEYAARAAELGGTVAMGPIPVEDAGIMATIIDPTGAAFALWQAVGHEGAGLVDAPGSLTWTELRTRDIEAARRFYGGLFGWTADREDVGPIEYWIFKHEGQRVAGLMTMDGMPHEVPAHWNVVFAVADAARAAELTRAHGGTVHFGPADLPAGAVVAISDPQGAELAYVQPPGA